VMWLIVLESAKDRVIGVDTPGQQVPPRVWYGMACLLIRDTVRSVPCSVSYPGSKKHRTEASIRVPRMFNHTHSNNMTNR
jgi:hypothetical protein